MSDVQPSPQFRQRALGALNEKVKAVVYEFANRITLAEAVGVLEIVKTELIQDHQQ